MLSENQVVENIRIVRSLSKGGQGEVYLGIIENKAFKKKVIIKKVGTDQKSLLENEAQIHAKLNHPNISQIYNFITDNGSDYIVSEYIEGQNLKQFILSKYPYGPTQDEVRKILGQLVIALNHLHENNIIHGDLCPYNVMLTEDLNVKIIDFGASSVVGDFKVNAYKEFYSLPPETLNDRPVQRDYFSLALLVYEIMTGERFLRERLRSKDGIIENFPNSDKLKKLPEIRRCLDPANPKLVNPENIISDAPDLHNIVPKKGHRQGRTIAKATVFVLVLMALGLSFYFLNKTPEHTILFQVKGELREIKLQKKGFKFVAEIEPYFDKDICNYLYYSLTLPNFKVSSSQDEMVLKYLPKLYLNGKKLGVFAATYCNQDAYRKVSSYQINALESLSKVYPPNLVESQIGSKSFRKELADYIRENKYFKVIREFITNNPAIEKDYRAVNAKLKLWNPKFESLPDIYLVQLAKHTLASPKDCDYINDLFLASTILKRDDLFKDLNDFLEYVGGMKVLVFDSSAKVDLIGKKEAAPIIELLSVSKKRNGNYCYSHLERHNSFETEMFFEELPTP